MKPGQNKDKFVRNDADKQEGASFPLSDAFRCALRGCIHTLKTQRNMKIHLAFAVVALILGLLFKIEMSGWLAILICIGLVFSMECINTALESIVDLVSPEYHELAKKAKDSAAAAVLVCATLSIVVAILVYGGAIVNLFMTGS